MTQNYKLWVWGVVGVVALVMLGGAIFYFGQPVEPHPATFLAFGEPIMLQKGQSITLSDGLKITLEQINDSRCKPGVQCVWAGELQGEFSATGGLIGSATERFTLETLQIREKAIGGYIFTLDVEKTTETTVVITVKVAEIRQSDCYIGGCSGQVCSDQPDAVSTCEYRPEYACYSTATCERQTNGQCGWTQTAELTACLQDPPRGK